MAASRINHVSVSADDLEESAGFYEELLGAERIPTPNFGFPVLWLAFGDTQLHLFQRGADAPAYHHFALTVGDVEPIYHKARERGALEDRMGHHLNELPGDTIQLYVRDPAGNLVEIDSLGAGRLPAELRDDMRRLADAHPQSEENLRARLFLEAGEPALPS